MSIESEFHSLIEQQDSEGKRKVWDKINGNIGAETNFIDDAVQVSNNALSINPKKIYISAYCVLAALAVVALILILTSKPGNPAGDVRFCSAADYSVNETTQTLKDYSQETNKDLLYFDWYEETEYLNDKVVRLNSDNEIICFMEEISDIESGYLIRIDVTDNLTVLDFLENFESSCPNSHTIDDIEIIWGVSEFGANAKFEYKSHIYYLSISDVIEEDYFIYLIEQLITK